MVDIQGQNSRKLLAPAAAFTMALIVILYTNSSIKAARREAEMRKRQELEAARARRADLGAS